MTTIRPVLGKVLRPVIGPVIGGEPTGSNPAPVPQYCGYSINDQTLQHILNPTGEAALDKLVAGSDYLLKDFTGRGRHGRLKSAPCHSSPYTGGYRKAVNIDVSAVKKLDIVARFRTISNNKQQWITSVGGTSATAYRLVINDSNELRMMVHDGTSLHQTVIGLGGQYLGGDWYKVETGWRSRDVGGTGQIEYAKINGQDVPITPQDSNFIDSLRQDASNFIYIGARQYTETWFWHGDLAGIETYYDDSPTSLYTGRAGQGDPWDGNRAWATRGSGHTNPNTGPIYHYQFLNNGGLLAAGESSLMFHDPDTDPSPSWLASNLVDLEYSSGDPVPANAEIQDTAGGQCVISFPPVIAGGPLIGQGSETLGHRA